MRAKKRIQLRRCQFCNKPGHNKATCPEFLILQKNTLAQPLQKNDKKVRIFYHAPEQKNSDTVSIHLLNLQKQSSHWQKTETVSPDNTNNEWEKFYQEIKAQTNKNSYTPEKTFILPEKEEIKTQIIKPEIKKEEDGLDFEKIIAAIKEENKKQQKTFFKKQSSKQVALKKIVRKPSQPLISFSFLQKTDWKRAFVAAMIVLIVVSIPLQTKTFYKNIKTSTEKITANSTEGFMALQDSASAIVSADLQNAQYSITEALQKFNEAVNEIQSHRILQTIAKNVPLVKTEVQSRQNIILAGQKLALGNTYLIKGIVESSDNELSPLKRLNTLAEHLNFAIPNYENAFTDLEKVDFTVLPVEYQAPFKDFKIIFSDLLQDLKSISDLSRNINEIFGGYGSRRYLLVFQNEAELRPTGGFIGSFAVLEVKNGEIISLDIPPGGSYDLQGQLSVLVEPPAPLLLSNKRWEFQDANWFPDFKTSAEKMLWFYRHSRSVTLDGVIAVNSSVLKRLITLVGPISDEQRNLVLDEKNILTSLQEVVEEGEEKKINKPKQILSDIGPQILSSLFSLKPENTLALLFNLNESLSQKEIQAYFTAPSLQQTIESFNWGGRIIKTPDDRDYLMVVNTNIQGQKSDASIKQKVHHQSLIEKDGSIINVVTITKNHIGQSGQKFYGQTNIDYIRLYVPEGSQLISAEGFTWPDEKYFRAPAKNATKDLDLQNIEIELGYDENSGTRITREFGKTVFGNWLITEPGTTNSVQFIYRLPFRLFNPDSLSEKNRTFTSLIIPQKRISQYQILVQKQSGSNTSFESQVIYPAGWNSVYSDGENSNLALNGHFVSETVLKNDKLWSLIMEQSN
ncbi:MAG TPA: DUF4012 domain-containing protein [Candidatus Magasanikbacteria bacterium]|mgnify:FL=1|nr:DUF4012 domain-containing protein [Candidatus Magasanikbacteria bacterium]